MAAHLSTLAGLVVPLGAGIGPLAVWLTRRDRDPFVDQAGREALNFGISIAIYGVVALVAALMLEGSARPRSIPRVTCREQLVDQWPSECHSGSTGINDRGPDEIQGPPRDNAGLDHSPLSGSS